MNGSNAVEYGRRVPLFVLLSLLLFLLVAGGAEAQWVDEGVLDESGEDTGKEELVLDPNKSPLYRLSLVEGIGRTGAGRIGARRGSDPIVDFQELRTVAVELDEEHTSLFRFARAPTFRLEVKQTFDWREGDRGDREEVLADRGDWSARVLFERDRAERRWDDFRSWNLVRRGKKIPLLLIGDLSVRFGSGLLVGTVAPFGAPLSTSIAGRSRLVPYRSRAESNAHFGAALETASLGGHLFLLGTSTGRDARIDENDLFSSIESSGYHRTDREESRRDALQERIVAFRWEKGGGRGAAGLTAGAVHYDPPSGGGDLRRKPNIFRGDRLQAVSADIRRSIGAADGTAECAWSSAGGGAFRGALSLRRRGIALATRFRSFSSRFHAPRGTVYHRFGSEPTGETGCMMVLACREYIIPGRMTARIHYFRSHARTWQSEEPVEGFDWYFRHEWRAGPLLPWISTGGEDRLETRRGARVSLARRSWGAGVRCGQAGGVRGRLEGKVAANLNSGTGTATRAAGLSCLVRRGGLALSWTRLFLSETALIFPVPALSGSIPLEWYGGGRATGGIRGSIAFPLPAGARGEAAFAADRTALEIGWGRNS